VGRSNFSDALPYLRVASTAQPRAARPHFLLGKCYQALKELDKAKTELLLATVGDPNDPQPHYLLSQVYREQGDKEASARAIQEFQRLSALGKQKIYERARTTPQ
jgi:predicted Zn-dependent protease